MNKKYIYIIDYLILIKSVFIQLAHLVNHCISINCKIKISSKCFHQIQILLKAIKMKKIKNSKKEIVFHFFHQFLKKKTLNLTLQF